MNKHYLSSLLRFLVVAALVIFGMQMLYYVASLTYPFIIAIVIALIINPFVDLLEEKLKLPRSLSVLVSIMLILGLLIGLVTLLVAEIISGAEHLAKVVPGSFESLVIFIEAFIAGKILPFYNQINSLFNNLNSNSQDTVLHNIENVGTKITQNVGEFIQSFLQGIPALLGWLPDAATVIIFSLLSTFFISKDWYRLKELSRKFMPLKARKSGRTVFQDLRKAMVGFVKAQFTLISITTVIVLIGLLILRVDYAITISLIIGFVDILPYLGTGLVFVPWIVYSTFTDNSSFAVGLSILYLLVIVQRQVMEPKILSSSIGIDPLATLISLFVGFKLFGFLGLIIGPVTLVVLKALHSAHVFRDIWHFIIGEKTM